MSDKIITEKLIESLSKSLDIMRRDLVEIKLLQSSSLNLPKFTYFAYRKILTTMVTDLKEHLNRDFSIITPNKMYFFNGTGISNIKISELFGADFMQIKNKNYQEIIKEVSSESYLSSTKKNFAYISPISDPFSFSRGSSEICASIAISGEGLFQISEKNDSEDPEDISQRINKYICSIVYDIAENEFYSAQVGQGAFLSDSFKLKMKISDIKEVKAATICISGKERWLKGNASSYSSEDKKKIIKAINGISIDAANCTTSNCPVSSLMKLASGKNEALIHADCCDVQALTPAIIIANEAGVEFYELNGTRCTLENINQLDGKGFIATSTNISQDFFRLFDF